nr:hypothetical protein [Melioribacteraceae bacterium]
IFYILFFLVTSLITKHESETNIILSIVTFLLVLPFLFIDKLIYTQDTFISYFLQYFPFTSFPALIIKSVKPIINNEQIIIAITVLIISIGILIYYISKFLFSASIIHNVINFYSKRKEK